MSCDRFIVKIETIKLTLSRILTISRFITIIYSAKGLSFDA